MCYSAMIRSEHRRYEREYGVQVSLRRYVELFWEKRRDGGWLRIPKAMRADFAEARTPAERELAELAAAADGEQARILEAELFRQKARLAEAERALAVRASRKAEDEQRIATDKIARAQRNLADLQRSHLMQRDARIFPGHYAPLIIWQDGGRVLVPMRYQCRLPGWSEADERRRPGTYNARRDNLGHAWRKLFGHQHGVLVVTAFFENVARHKLEHRPLPAGEAEENVVLEFSPQPPADMLLACLWSYSPGEGGGPGLYSFAAITDEPPPEVAAAGHDRCIIPLRPGHLDAWLQPDPHDLAAQQAILDDRAPLHFAHRLAA
ncbi:SOS response-associated peptidase family protein [Cupriavidus malaysiensis]|uniref:DUF159 family protein n=1 Tax=Cupriavidus malaysiensis TaxID=367825 RepID=A0ABM6F447_9BURK|nr:SOS response-associated peptidase family protein [Cupriavidus malaysiensis]AOZ06208.1 hypothetical protein BKK80_10455 [Cupriavidus malaysiensis]